MTRKVLVFDTSVLCCWLRIPGKDKAGPDHDQWDFNRVDKLINEELGSRNTLFVLPIASLIETGNHIAKCPGNRYLLANTLTNHLLASVNTTSPWAAFSHQNALWEPENLQELASIWPTLAVGGTSIGDATIKHVAEHYAKAGFNVEILTGDQGLKAYQPLRPSLVPRRRSGRIN